MDTSTKTHEILGHPARNADICRHFQNETKTRHINHNSKYVLRKFFVLLFYFNSLFLAYTNIWVQRNF